MTRTFSTLAVVLLALFCAATVAGFISFSMKFQAGSLETRQQVFLVHFYLGLGTAIAILLVHSLVFMYFLGTGRWVKEVGLAYQLPDDPHPRTTRELKRQTFPPALFAMLSGIATAAAGAGADAQAWPWQIHALAALFTLAVNVWAFRIEYRNLAINAGIIQAVMDDVDRIRRAQGLNSNSEALLEEENRN